MPSAVGVTLYPGNWIFKMTREHSPSQPASFRILHLTSAAQCYGGNKEIVWPDLNMYTLYKCHLFNKTITICRQSLSLALCHLPICSLTYFEQFINFQLVHKKRAQNDTPAFEREQLKMHSSRQHETSSPHSISAAWLRVEAGPGRCWRPQLF